MLVDGRTLRCRAETTDHLIEHPPARPPSQSRVRSDSSHFAFAEHSCRQRPIDLIESNKEIGYLGDGDVGLRICLHQVKTSLSWWNVLAVGGLERSRSGFPGKLGIANLGQQVFYRCREERARSGLCRIERAGSCG